MDTYEYPGFFRNTPKYTHPAGLAVMRALMHRLGDPQEALRCVHIAGTNGKGSTAAMTASILQAAGCRTGLYTSPDLIDLRERIRLDGVNITHDALEAAARRVKDACRDLPEPSFFEKITAAAFLYYAEADCGAVVLETGLGGRCDATNIIEAPLCSVITPIGRDHTAVLGDTLSAIAGEKAGILKPGRPVICAPQEPEALAVLRRTAEDRGCPLHMVDITKLTIRSRSPEGQRFDYGGAKDLSLSLLGDHQAENAACALETARVLGLSDAAIRKGLSEARWPCRFEVFPGDVPILLDGAHNAHGAAALAAGLRQYFPGRRFTMIMGVMADKDVSDILALMEPLAARFICLAPDYDRALAPEALAGLIRTVPARAAADPGEALALARRYGDPICAFGSLYYIGYLREIIEKEQ